MLLVIDVGNTNIVLGVYDKKNLVGHWRISTDRVRTTDEYGMLMMNLFFMIARLTQRISRLLLFPL